MKEKFNPYDFHEKILENIDYDWKVIVIAKENKEEALKLIRQLGMLSLVGDDFNVSILNLISGFAATIFGRNLLKLAQAECISAIWYVDEGIYKLYVRTIKSLEDLFNKLPHEPVVVSISLSPSEDLIPMPYNPEEPINIAIRIAAENNKIIVFAAGNFGPKENTLNPWSLAPWVFSVGAASKDGNLLARFSSRGCTSDIFNRPTVVAPGIDIITTHPPDTPKNKIQLEAEKRIGFYEKVKKEDWPSYTVVSGTSIATPHVSRIVGLIMHYLLNMLDEYKKDKGTMPRSFAQIYTHDQTMKFDERVTSQRLVGNYKDFGNVRIVKYPLGEPFPLIIKQILMDMAIGIANYKPHEVGAGFINIEIATHYFGKYGEPNPELFIYKVIE